MEKITYSGNVKILRKTSTGDLEALAEYKNEGSSNLFNLLLDSLDYTYTSDTAGRKPKYLAIVNDNNKNLLGNNGEFQALSVTKLPVDDNNIYALQLEFYVNGSNTSDDNANLLLLSGENTDDISSRIIASINTGNSYLINSDETHIIRWTLSLRNR